LHTYLAGACLCSVVWRQQRRLRQTLRWLSRRPSVQLSRRLLTWSTRPKHLPRFVYISILWSLPRIF